MPYRPVTTDSFGGLNLSSDPYDVGFNQALDMLDTTITPRGMVAVREGQAQFKAQTTYQWIHRLPPNWAVAFRKASTTITLDVIQDNASGTPTVNTVTDTFTSTSNVTDTTVIGSTSTFVPILYIAQGGVGLVQKYNIAAAAGTEVSDGVGKPVYLTTSPTDNRLVQGNFVAAGAPNITISNGSPSMVFFSDPGAPDTYTASSYVHLRPGDGEVLQGLVTWRELIFAFKKTNAFIFYGTSTLSSGIAQFNYRPLRLPGELVSSPVVGDDGVYFATHGGIWVTNGTTIRSISEQISLIFKEAGEPAIDPIYRRTLTGGQTNIQLSFADGRLWVCFPNDAGSFCQLVYNPKLDYWTRVSFRVDPGITGQTRQQIVQMTEKTVFLTAAGASYFTRGAIETSGANPYYRSGWTDFDSQEQKVSRQVLMNVDHVTAAGDATFVLTQYDETETTGTATSMELTAAAGSGRQYLSRDAKRGRQLSYKVEGTGYWRMSSITHYLREQKAIGTGQVDS